MRRIVKHGLVGLSVSALASVAVVGSFGHADAATDDPPVAVSSSSPVPSSGSSSAAPTQAGPSASVTPSTDPQQAAMDATFGTFREGASRTVQTGPMNVAKDARLIALATQAQQISSQHLRIIQQQQIDADQKQADAVARQAAEDAAKIQAEVAAEAARQAAAEQQQSQDQAAADAAAAAAASSSQDTTTQTETYSGSDPRQIAKQMMASKYGWGADQFSCLNSIYVAESNWKTTAENPSSGAYGIPQSLPGSKMAAAGSDWRTNPTTQISWGLSYIKSRYGTPCKALSFRRGAGYY